MGSDGETSAKFASERKYRDKRQNHWDMIARKKDSWQSKGTYYHNRINEIYNHLAPPDQKVLEIGCGTGELLASLKPSLGVGVDLSGEMVRRATAKYPHLRFIQADAHEMKLNETFDIIILSDLINDLWDVQAVFKILNEVSDTKTRILINTYSRIWELPLLISQFF
jgi:ubiquinone/menaquinone biosynthesis C-methylase UbiE